MDIKVWTELQEIELEMQRGKEVIESAQKRLQTLIFSAGLDILLKKNETHRPEEN